MSYVIFAGTKMLPVELIVEETDFFLFGVLLIKLILWIFEPDRIIILIIFIIVVIFSLDIWLHSKSLIHHFDGPISLVAQLGIQCCEMRKCA